MSNGKTNGRFNVDDIKRAASGRWAEIIPALTGIPADLLDGKNHPCPNTGCGGQDRFRAFDNVAAIGGLFCNQCHNGDTKPKSGDGIAAVQWLTGWTFPQTLKAIAELVGVVPVDPADDTRDIIGDLCRQKNMPIESAKAYGAEIATRGSNRVVRFPVYDSDGNATSYSDCSPYAKGKLNKGMLPKGGSAGLHFPDGRLPKPGETWLLVEGVKDASALHGLGFDAAGITGCNLANDKRERFGKLFVGCELILIPDLDRASLRGFHNIGESFAINAASVAVGILPGEVKPIKGDDVRDIIQRDGADAVRKTIENAAVFDPADLLDGRQAVYLNITDHTEKEVADRVIRVLADAGFNDDDSGNRIYQRASKLVIVADAGTGPMIAPINDIGIRERISASMDLIEKSGGAGEETETVKRPPGWLYKAIHARACYDHVRRLDGIVTAPTMRADGSILQTAGYDSESRLLYLPDGDYETIPANPTLDDARRAAGELLDIVQDFPFADDVAKSVWLSLVLSLLARAAIVGNVPLIAFTANIRGSGKSKLCE